MPWQTQWDPLIAGGKRVLKSTRQMLVTHIHKHQWSINNFFFLVSISSVLWRIQHYIPRFIKIQLKIPVIIAIQKEVISLCHFHRELKSPRNAVEASIAYYYYNNKSMGYGVTQSEFKSRLGDFSMLYSVGKELHLGFYICTITIEHNSGDHCQE